MLESARRSFPWRPCLFVAPLVVLAIALFDCAAAAPPPKADEPKDPAPFDEAQAIARLKQQIAGKENEPAGSVFKNVQVLGAVPAGRLLGIMKIGYAGSLGVTCTHCHVAGDWGSDDNAHKRIARQMSLMTRELNEKTLPAIPELAGKEPRVNCTTCHRGQEKPALSLEEEPAVRPAAGEGRGGPGR
ncbi:MAG TPA: c-type cytochrome [Thermoanaerobaculia bacterium]|nr:c-type cytochrome [Thermoanaerobaculia bacterium]